MRLWATQLFCVRLDDESQPVQSYTYPCTDTVHIFIVFEHALLFLLGLVCEPEFFAAVNKEEVFKS